MIAIEFIGACSVNPVLETRIVEVKARNVGELTIDVLEKFEVPFKGTEQGLNSAFNTPVGMEAMEILSDDEMRSYGWCYSIDGVNPESYPDTIPVLKVKKVSWFFGYAHYVKGEWISQCEPAWKIKPAFLCSKH